MAQNELCDVNEILLEYRVHFALVASVKSAGLVVLPACTKFGTSRLQTPPFRKVKKPWFPDAEKCPIFAEYTE